MIALIVEQPICIYSKTTPGLPSTPFHTENKRDITDPVQSISHEDNKVHLHFLPIVFSVNLYRSINPTDEEIRGEESHGSCEQPES